MLDYKFSNNLIVISLLAITWLLHPTTTHGQNTDDIESYGPPGNTESYEFLQPLPFFGDTIDINEESLVAFMNSLIQIAIGFAILLAIIMVIVAGVEYMGSGSFSSKKDAKQRITKALGGLFLALAAVLILQTINPNLVRLDVFEEVTVQSQGPPDGNTGWCLVDVDYPSETPSACYDNHSDCLENQTLVITGGPMGLERDICVYKSQESDSYDTGTFADRDGYCATIDTGTFNPYYCADSMSKCEETTDAWKNVDPSFVTEECQDFTTEEDEFTFESTGRVVDSNGSELTSISGTGTADTKSIAKEIAKNACSQAGVDWISDNSGVCSSAVDCTVEGCDSAEEIGESTPNQLLADFVLEGSPSESEVRQTLWNQSPTIYTNRGGESDPRDGTYCESVDDSACTNLGGLSQEAINGLQQFNQNFTSSPFCNNTDCNLTVTGGTSWWFHGEQKKDPLEQIGSTHHNPVGIDPQLGTGAVDLRKFEDEKLKSYIQANGCVVAGNSYQVGKHYFLNESDHWHVVFNEYQSSCGS